jgi:hypothetical protein
VKVHIGLSRLLIPPINRVLAGPPKPDEKVELPERRMRRFCFHSAPGMEAGPVPIASVLERRPQHIEERIGSLFSLPSRGDAGAVNLIGKDNCGRLNG